MKDNLTAWLHKRNEPLKGPNLWLWLNKPINSLHISILIPCNENESMQLFIKGKEELLYSKYHGT